MLNGDIVLDKEKIQTYHNQLVDYTLLHIEEGSHLFGVDILPVVDIPPVVDILPVVDIHPDFLIHLVGSLKDNFFKYWKETSVFVLL